MSHVLEIDIAGYFPSALAPSGHQRVLLSAGDNPAVAGSRYTIFARQPFCRRGIHQRSIDFASMLPAELLKRPVGDKHIPSFS